MKKALLLVASLCSCGGDTGGQGGSQEPPAPGTKGLNCQIETTLTGDPSRSVTALYSVLDSEDGSRKMNFSVSYEVEGQSPIVKSDSKTYEATDDAKEHAVGIAGAYIAYSHGDHAHLFSSHNKQEQRFSCEVK